MNCKNLKYSGHIIRRMFEREITDNDIITVINKGEIITEYPNDKPFPSKLILGVINKRPIHIVIASDLKGDCILITVYEPDLKIWNNDFKTKKEITKTKTTKK